MNFDSCFKVIVEIEGGLIDDERDLGGITHWGISLGAFPELGREGIKKLTQEEAKKLYKEHYWNPMRLDEMPEGIRMPIFDCAVNQGVSGAIKCLQKTLKIKADGIIGKQTIAAVNGADQEELAALFLADRSLFYAKSKRFEIYGRGWMKRLFIVAIKMEESK
jgi:lysozyme family protein